MIYTVHHHHSSQHENLIQALVLALNFVVPASLPIDRHLLPLVAINNLVPALIFVLSRQHRNLTNIDIIDTVHKITASHAVFRFGVLRSRDSQAVATRSIDG